MAEFQYSACDVSGKRINGKRHALSAEDLALQLQHESLIPLDISKITKPINETTGRHTLKSTSLFKEKVSQEELQILCRQMYTVLKAGIPIAVAVARFAETSRDKTLVHALQQILASLNQGRSLHVSLAQFPEIFSNFFINLVKVGENTGQLERVFLHLSEYLEMDVDTKKKFKSALRYPMLVIVAILIALIVINIFVIPAMASFFSSFKATLPLPTRILLAISNFIIHYWYVLIAIAAGVWGSLRYYIKTKAGELKWAEMQLKIPLVGWLLHRIILARFTRLYALVLRSGLTAVDGLELVGSSLGNAYVYKKILGIANQIGRGNTISNSISQTQLFTPLVIQMITLGEETGHLDSLLDDVAEFYQREIAYDLLRLSDAIEPIMLVIIGAMVLVLALGVFLPMWELAGQMH